MMARIQRSLMPNSCERSEYEVPRRYFWKRLWFRMRHFAALALGIQSFFTRKAVQDCEHFDPARARAEGFDAVDQFLSLEGLDTPSQGLVCARFW